MNDVTPNSIGNYICCLFTIIATIFIPLSFIFKVNDLQPASIALFIMAFLVLAVSRSYTSYVKEQERKKVVPIFKPSLIKVNPVTIEVVSEEKYVF